MNYYVKQIDRNDPYYARYDDGEYLVIHAESGACEAAGFGSYFEALNYIAEIDFDDPWRLVPPCLRR